MKTTLITAVLLFAGICLVPAISYAQDGSLDLTFSSDGKVTTAIGGSNDYGFTVAIQNDGKIVVAGETFNGSDADFGLVRYNSDGTLDNSFDTDGKVTTDFGAMDNSSESVVIQADGKIIVAGVSYNGTNNDIALARYNTDGSLDNTFDSDGKVITPIGTGSDYGKAITIQSDGKILVTGSSSGNTVLVRYNTDGSLDNTFDTDGKVTTDFGGSGDIGRSIAIQSDGKILVAGDGGNIQFALARYNNDGSLDNTFDADGKVLTAFGSEDRAHSIAIQGDGKIIAAGVSLNGTNRDFAIARYNIDGSLDNTFDSDGKAITAVGSSYDKGSSVAIQVDGKILVAGESDNGSNYDFALVRYNTNGSLDNTFDTDGKLLTNFGGGSDDQGFSIAIQGDGKIVVAGYSNADFAVARYNNTLVGIEENFNSKKDINISPNPTTGILTVNTSKETSVERIMLYSIEGKKVFESAETSGNNSIRTIDIQNLSQGIYFLECITKKGSEKVKVVKY